MKFFLKYFLRGLIFAAPVGVVVLLLISLSTWIEAKVEESHLHWYIFLIGLAAIIFLLFLLGYVGSTLLIRPIRRIVDQALKRIPLINFIYTSLSDLMNAFVGDKKKFNKPVLVKLNKITDEERLGFITQEDLEDLDMPGKVAIYFPHSYAFSGTLSIFPKENVTRLNASGASTMKFIVSGGVTKLEDEEHHELNKRAKRKTEKNKGSKN